MKRFTDFDLTEYNSYRLQSFGRNVFFPETLEEIKELISLPNLIILGGGCNVILSKTYFDKENIIFIRDNYSGIERNGAFLRVKAGTDLKDLSLYALENELSGMEYFYDIPGCVGGATIMNAGCQGISFSDFIETITFLDLETKEITTVEKKDAAYEYRNNIFSKKKVIILDVLLKLAVGKKTDIYSLMLKNRDDRWRKQPREFPSAGSVFKRPKGHFVGPMITDCGLKGYRIGGAQISDKHAGFIINVDNASADDIITLARLAKDKVNEKFGVELNMEQRIV